MKWRIRTRQRDVSLHACGSRGPKARPRIVSLLAQPLCLPRRMAPSDPSSQSGAPNLSAGINITLIVMFLSFTYFRESPPDQSRNYPTLTLQPNLIDVQTRRYHVEGRAVHLDEVQEAEKVEQPHLRPKSLVESYCLPNVPCHLHCPEASGPETCDRSSMHSPPSGALPL